MSSASNDRAIELSKALEKSPELREIAKKKLAEVSAKNTEDREALAGMANQQLIMMALARLLDPMKLTRISNRNIAEELRNRSA